MEKEANNFNEEIWVTLDGYNGNYAISNYGRVRSNATGRLLRLYKHGKKIRACLTSNSKSKPICVTDVLPSYFTQDDYFVPTNCDYLNSFNKPIGYMDDIPGEIWKDIKDHEGAYQVSNLGRIKSLDREILHPSPKGIQYSYVNQGTMLRTNPDACGYLLVNIAGCMCKVHRLVAQTFIVNSCKLPQVNHIDGVKTNNTVGNLEWVTASENILHAYELGLIKRGPKGPSNRLTQEDVRYIRMSRGITQNRLAEIFGVSRTSIQRVLSNKTHKK